MVSLRPAIRNLTRRCQLTGPKGFLKFDGTCGCFAKLKRLRTALNTNIVSAKLLRSGFVNRAVATLPFRWQTLA